MPTAYITAPRSHAHEIATDLVESKLAACVNRIHCESTYVWDGEVKREAEEILLAKTSADRFDELVTHVQEHHPDDVPCIERFDEDEVLEEYRDWIETETAP